MTEQDVYDQYDNWQSRISKYVISRSSRLLSPETQKDGRTLLSLSALSSLFYIGLIKFVGLEFSGTNIEYPKGIQFIPVVVEFVCIYFAISFIIDSFSDLKIWQFKTLIKGSDDENPFEIIERERDRIKMKGDDILERYNKVIQELSLEYEVDKQISPAPDPRDRKDYDTWIDEMEKRTGNLKKYHLLYDILIEKQKIELNNLDAERHLLKYKIDSYSLAVVPVVKAYNLKRFVNIFFPIISFSLSICALFFYLISR